MKCHISGQRFRSQNECVLWTCWVSKLADEVASTFHFTQSNFNDTITKSGVRPADVLMASERCVSTIYVALHKKCHLFKKNKNK